MEPLNDSYRVRRDVGRESGIILSHALGFNPKDVRAIHIHWQAGEMPYAEVELYLNEHAVFEIVQLRPELIVADAE
jgi:hypothetical protein